MLLPLNDLQGQIGGLAATNVLKNQLDTGEFSAPTILAAVKDSGAMDVTLEDGKEGDKGTVEAYDSRQEAEYRINRIHQGTQTEPFSLSIAHVVVHGKIGDASAIPCKYNID